jgi:hypothetical protein
VATGIATVPKEATMSRIEELAIERGELVLTRWPDRQPGAFDADSDDALLYLTPIIGACQTIALHHMAKLVTTLPEPAVYTLNVPSFAQALGLSTAIGPNAKIIKVFGRLERFGFIRHSGTVEVRTTIPPLARRHVERMPEYLRATAPSV